MDHGNNARGRKSKNRTVHALDCIFARVHEVVVVGVGEGLLDGQWNLNKQLS